MSEQGKLSLSSDEMLVAFLDGQLSPDDQQAIAELLETDETVVQRLSLLSAGKAPFRDAFDALLDDAPTLRMAEKFRRAAFQEKVEAPKHTRRHLIAAAITLVVVGAGGGVGIDRVFNPPDDDGWRSVVANYMSLYSTVTLANLSRDPEMLDRQVGTVSQLLGLPLDRASVSVPGLELRRAQILQFKDKPLAQFAFLDSGNQPLALCIIASSSRKSAPAVEERRGMNVVFWSSDTHSFLVIGHQSRAGMEGLADKFREGLTA